MIGIIHMCPFVLKFYLEASREVDFVLAVPRCNNYAQRRGILPDPAPIRELTKFAGYGESIGNHALRNFHDLVMIVSSNECPRAFACSRLIPSYRFSS